MRVSCTVILVLLDIAVPGLAFSQNARDRHVEAYRSDSRIIADADLALINATVMDSDNRLVTDLHPEDFRVFDEKDPVRIVEFAMEDGPISTVILLNKSKSMKGKIENIRLGLKRYLDASLPEHDFCLTTFDDHVSGPCSFTGDATVIVEQASVALPKGGTALIDAIIRGLSEIKKGTNARKALLILSDGVNTMSRFNWRDSERYAKETTACLYLVVPESFHEDKIYSIGRLETLVELTGGRNLEVNNARDYTDFFNRLDIRQQYIIGFKPTESARDGKYRRVKVRLQHRHKNNVTVYWKRGHYASIAIN